jgi:surface antigen
MRATLVALALAGAMAASGCETTGYGGGAGGTQLSQCMRNALIGAGVGAAVGYATAPNGNRGENAALGAAAGGLGTYGICRFLAARERQQVENAYYQSLNSGQSVNDSWTSDQGATRNLSVATPSVAPGYGGDCRRINATITDPAYGVQTLPAETFCRTANGQWVPA